MILPLVLRYQKRQLFYMAPEQILRDNNEIDEKTDVFLLGGILYEILTHLPPYAPETQQGIMEMAIVPKGMLHRLTASERAAVLLFEKKALSSAGG